MKGTREWGGGSEGGLREEVGLEGGFAVQRYGQIFDKIALGPSVTGSIVSPLIFYSNSVH